MVVSATDIVCSRSPLKPWSHFLFPVIWSVTPESIYQLSSFVFVTWTVKLFIEKLHESLQSSQQIFNNSSLQSVSNLSSYKRCIESYIRLTTTVLLLPRLWDGMRYIFKNCVAHSSSMNKVKLLFKTKCILLTLLVVQFHHLRRHNFS